VFLQNFKGAVLAVTHDRFFLDNVASTMLEIENGKLHEHHGNYSSWVQAKQIRDNLIKKKVQSLEKLIRKEEVAMLQGKQAQRGVSKARISNYEALVEEHKQLKFKDRVASGRLIIPFSKRLGDVVLSVRDLCLKFDDNLGPKKTIMDHVSFEIPPKSIVGIIGPNGCGKTTLFRVLTGDLKPEEGTVDFGQTVSVGYASQNRTFFNENNTIVDEVSGGGNFVDIGEEEPLNVRLYLAQFNFRDGAQLKRIKDLSGGERNRVHLAKFLLGKHNLLLFDEPTNDLDAETLRSLEEGLKEFPGASIIIR